MLSQPQSGEGGGGEPLFWILALDGGGLRGAFSAHLLTRIEDEFAVSVSSRFDLVAGTSTGSILAAAIVLQRPLSAVEDIYADHGPAIFLGRWWSAGGKLASKYDAVRLKSVLEGELGATLLGDIRRPALLIPAADIGNGQVHVFKSQYNKEFVRDKGVRVADAVLSSCSAPTFFAPHVVGDYRLVDGGIWANNPTLVAAIDAIRRFGVEAARIRILSIGTGAERFTYPRGRGLLSRAWGFLTGWQRGKLIELMLSLQSQASTNMATLLLGKDHILRLNFFDSRLPMDDPTTIGDLRARADALFTVASEDIRKFLDAVPRTTTNKE